MNASVDKSYVCQRCYKEISSSLSDDFKAAINNAIPSNRLYLIELYCHQIEEGVIFQLDTLTSSINIFSVN